MKNKKNDPGNPFVLGGSSPPSGYQKLSSRSFDGLGTYKDSRYLSNSCGNDTEVETIFENQIESTELEWLSTKEAALYLRVPIASLRNMTSNGCVPHYKFGRLNRYLKSELKQLLLSKRRGV